MNSGWDEILDLWNLEVFLQATITVFISCYYSVKTAPEINSIFQKNFGQDTYTVTTRSAILFPIIASIFLLCIFYFLALMSVILTISTVITSFFAVFFCTTPYC